MALPDVDWLTFGGVYDIVQRRSETGRACHCSVN
jgi:hypothetical protein